MKDEASTSLRPATVGDRFGRDDALRNSDVVNPAAPGTRGRPQGFTLAAASWESRPPPDVISLQLQAIRASDAVRIDFTLSDDALRNSDVVNPAAPRPQALRWPRIADLLLRDPEPLQLAREGVAPEPEDLRGEALIALRVLEHGENVSALDGLEGPQRRIVAPMRHPLRQPQVLGQQRIPARTARRSEQTAANLVDHVRAFQVASLASDSMIAVPMAASNAAHALSACCTRAPVSFV